MSTSAAKLVKHFIAKNGPMSNQSLFKLVPQYEKDLISKSHLKKKVLQNLEGQGILIKKVNHQAGSKPIWEWQFKNAEDIEKYKNL
ncbi:hypothetical protein CU097_008990 [Rhizopus azygosporus]|uniref:Uncharacterized protein n=1 Tax=Rhizopus azygosporus TaxID=86630 RepID=A0A367K344_RHIAZ|nr:hypothetical protein CU097_008990 [Rhizopus azygosporus]